MKNLTIKDINETFHLVTDSNESEHIRDCFNTEYENFFVLIKNGEYTFVYGFNGIPYLHKALNEIVAQY